MTVLIIVARIWFPGAHQYKTELESYLCELTGQQVTVGRLETRFHGLTPSFTAKDVVVFQQGQKSPSLELANVDADIDLFALLVGKARVKKLVIESPSLIVERLDDGHFVIGGVGLSPSKNKTDLKATLDKILDQKHLEIRNARIVWQDRKYPDSPNLVLKNADMEFIGDGNHHALHLKADIGSLTPRLEIRANLAGDPLDGLQSWAGGVDLQVDALDLGILPPILAEVIHTKLIGRMDLAAQSHWEKGGIVNGSADISGDGVEIGLKDVNKSVQLANFNNRFQWGGRVANGDWELVSSGFDLPLIQPEVDLRNELRLVRQDGGLQLSLGYAGVNDIRQFIAGIDDSKPLVKKLAKLNPRGILRNLVFEMPEGVGKPELFTLRTQVDQFENEPYEKIPGLSGIRGELNLSRFEGKFVLDSGKSAVKYPKYFSQVITLDHANSEVEWRKDGGIWLISANKTSLKNPDIEARGDIHLAYPEDHTLSPQLKLDIHYGNGNGEHASRYYPDKIMHAKLVDWLNKSIKGGHVTQGSLRFEGPVKKFPFYNDEGVFILHADIARATLDYFAGWPQVDKSDVSLRVNGPAMTITGNGGTLNGQTIKSVHVHIADLKAHENHVKISGELTGSASNVVDFLSKGPLRGKKAKPLPGWSAAGNGHLNISLDLPLSEPSKVKVNGEYLMQDVVLRIPGGIRITDLNNSIEFTENLVQCKNLSGQMLGGEVSIAVSTPKPDRFAEVLVEADGKADPEHLKAFVGNTIARALSGKAAWKGAVRVTRKGVTMEINSDLKGIASRAPAPLNKPSKALWPLQVKSSFASNEPDRTSFSLNSRLYGNMVFSGAESNYGLEAAKIVVGSGRGGWANTGMVEVVLDSEKLNADDWIDFFTAGSTKTTSGQAPKKPGFAEKLNRVAGKIGQLHALSRDFGAVNFSVARNADDRSGWIGTMGGDSATGNIEFSWLDKQKKIDASLSKLVWPESNKPRSAGPKKWDPESLPDITLAVLDAHYGNINLGQMNLSMKPGKTRWEIRRLDLTRPDMTLKVSDQATVTGPRQKITLPQTKVVSQFNVFMKSSDLGATLAALDYSDQMVGKSAEINGTVYWPGGPEDFSWSTLNTDLRAELNKGSILRVKPGLGRMLGALNLESLLRRLKLDFTDVFEKGFAFDKITGDIRIRNGEGFTDELVISGPGANIILSGRTALVDRTYNMRVTVIPPLGGNASLVGFALGGPAAGVLIWLGDKLLKHPLGKLVHYEYKVTGSWDEPVVEALSVVDKGSLPNRLTE